MGGFITTKENAYRTLYDAALALSTAMCDAEEIYDVDFELVDEEWTQLTAAIEKVRTLNQR